MSSDRAQPTVPAKLLVTHQEAGTRLDIFLSECSGLQAHSRTFLQNLVKKQGIKVNGLAVRPSHKLRHGDTIEISLPPPEQCLLKAEPVNFQVIYEDDHILVLIKPAGLVVHPAAGHRSGTLVHGLLYYCHDLSGISGEERPGIVHRLDQDTSGVMVVAKNDLSHRHLVRQFASRRVKKTYLALVVGIPTDKKGRIDKPIGRHPVNRKKMAVTFGAGREASTEWLALEAFDNKFSLLDVSPLTGRTHQIRVHLSYLGFPIVGDPLYGGKGKIALLPEAPRICLHARALSFFHPATGEPVTFSAPLPEDMQTVIDRLRRLTALTP